VRRLLALLPLFVIAGGCGSSPSHRSPDIIFVSTRDGDYALFGVDVEGGDEERLTKEKGDPATPAGLFFQIEPAWSADGRMIAFASRRGGRSHIYVMRRDGSRLRRITSARLDDDHPTWSPDGRSIAFAREGALFVVPAEGGRARRLLRAPGNAADPAWAPSGRLFS
jgi:TolB protein